MDKSRVKSILLISLSNLGDIVLTTPVLRKLHDEFPDAVIDVVTGMPGRDIFLAHPAVRKVIINKRRKTLRSRLLDVLLTRRQKYDLVVDLKNSLMPYVAGARYGTRSLSSFLGGIKRLSSGVTAHKRTEHLAKLRTLGIDAERDVGFYVPVSEEDARQAESLIVEAERTLGPGVQRDRIVVINPGTKNHLKKWKASNYAKLSDMLSGEKDCIVFLTGTDEDRQTVNDVIAATKRPVLDVCSRTTIGCAAGLMARACMVITGDSAPLHIASAVGTPTVAIFGPTDEKKYGPLAEKSVVLNPRIGCRPCGKGSCQKRPPDGCINDVTVEEVYRAAEKILEGTEWE
ncbi:MAG: glycosyltransferase family 9 protein [Candidatus Omnitrophica bacterium]|nr:glycosyltransferase family 9 protein [Candidatus Omnitrophota bacterium]